MNAGEINELNKFLAECVMGWRSGRSGMQSRSDPTDDSWLIQTIGSYRNRFKRSWNPTKDSEDAMDVLKKCAENIEFSICKSSETYWIASRDERFEARNTSLELAICLFAKQLFSKDVK